MTCAVYAVWNRANDRRYIGSSIDAETRMRAHMTTLARGVGTQRMQPD